MQKVKVSNELGRRLWLCMHQSMAGIHRNRTHNPGDNPCTCEKLFVTLHPYLRIEMFPPRTPSSEQRPRSEFQAPSARKFNAFGAWLRACLYLKKNKHQLAWRERQTGGSEAIIILCVLSVGAADAPVVVERERSGGEILLRQALDVGEGSLVLVDARAYAGRLQIGVQHALSE